MRTRAHTHLYAYGYGAQARAHAGYPHPPHPSQHLSPGASRPQPRPALSLQARAEEAHLLTIQPDGMSGTVGNWLRSSAALQLQQALPWGGPGWANKALRLSCSLRTAPCTCARLQLEQVLKSDVMNFLEDTKVTMGSILCVRSGVGGW